MKIRIFLFHRVTDEKDPLWTPMTCRRFEEIIKLINKKFNVISLDEMYSTADSYKGHKKLAAVCFDDGYLDNLQYAAPILDKYKSPCTFFVVGDCISSGFATWTFQLDHSFSHTSVKELHLSTDVPADLKDIIFHSDEERIQFARKLKPYLKTVNNQKRSQILNEISTAFIDVHQPVIMMNWNQINQLIAGGFQIGAHSVSHPLLASIQDETEIRQEIKGSAEIIYAKTGILPSSFAYPVGSYDERVKRITKEAGFKMGFAVDNRIADTFTDDPFAIPRLELYEENWVKTKLRMSGSIQKMKSLFS